MTSGLTPVISSHHSLIDWLNDVDLWIEPALFRGLGIFLPGLALWPDGILSTIFAGISKAHKLLGIPKSLRHRQYHEPVIAYVRTITDRRVVVVGHSLGGGLAQLVGATAGVPCVSFSGTQKQTGTQKQSHPATEYFEIKE